MVKISKYITDSKLALILYAKPLLRAIGQEEISCPGITAA